MNTKTLPPIEILDLLHKCEEMGIDLPREIDKWWERETIAQQEEQERKLRIQKELRKSTETADFLNKFRETLTPT